MSPITHAVHVALIGTESELSLPGVFLSEFRTFHFSVFAISNIHVFICFAISNFHLFFFLLFQIFICSLFVIFGGLLTSCFILLCSELCNDPYLHSMLVHACQRPVSPTLVLAPKPARALASRRRASTYG